MYDHSSSGYYTQIDSQINFDLGYKTMLSSVAYPAQYFSVIWRGFVKAPSTETYRIFMDTHNTSFVQVYFNGTLKIQNDFTGKGSD